jgi:hypothetical protein
VDSGLVVAGAELVVAGGEASELLEFGEATLDRVADLVCGLVESSRSATGAALVDPVGVLVVQFRDPVADLPASQVVAKRPAALGLVAQQDSRTGVRRPARRRHRDRLQRGLRV